MRENQLEEELRRAEGVYDGLVQTQRSLGTMLAEEVRKGRDLDEFERHLRELPHLTRQADFRRTELRHELLALRAKRAKNEYQRAAAKVGKAARSLEQARKAFVEADEAARRSGLEAHRLAELREREANRLEQLRQAPEGELEQHEGEERTERQEKT